MEETNTQWHPGLKPAVDLNLPRRGQTCHISGISASTSRRWRSTCPSSGCEALMELMEPEMNKIMENVRKETEQQVTQRDIKNAIVKAYGISDSEAESCL